MGHIKVADSLRGIDAELFLHEYFPTPYLKIADTHRVGTPEYARNAADRFRYFLRTGL